MKFQGGGNIPATFFHDKRELDSLSYQRSMMIEKGILSFSITGTGLNQDSRVFRVSSRY
jgi:hypothetical protein